MDRRPHRRWHPLIHLPPAHHSHPPSHIHCYIPGSKLTFSTNLSHHSLLAPTWTAFLDYTELDLFCSAVFIFRSTSKSRPNNIRGGKCPSVRPSVRTSVRPSTKSFFDFNEIWYIGRGRWVMHDGMPYNRIQGQGQGHEPLKVWIPSIFKTYLLRHFQWELASDY